MSMWRGTVANVVVMGAILAVQTAAPPRESLIDRLLRISGLTAAPSQMRGPADDVLVGNIWIVPAEGGASRGLTTDGGYRSPIFSAADGMIYALKENALVRLPAQGGPVTNLQDAKGFM